MQLKELWVSDYKNLTNVSFSFKSKLTSLLVGKNGLGKSNLIEILGLIFRDLDLIMEEEDFKNWPFGENQFEYSINYMCNEFDVLINCRKGIFECGIKKVDSSEPHSTIEFRDFIKNRKDSYLPKYIIGYYSGENKRIEKIIGNHEAIEKENLKKFQKKGTNENLSLRRLFFTQNFHSQLLLLTLAVYRGHSFFKDKIDDLFYNYLDIEKIVDFDIKFNNPNWNYSKIDGHNKGGDYLLANISADVEYPFWNIKGKVDKLLTRLYNHQIENGKEPIAYDNDHIEDGREFVKEFLLFDGISFVKFIEDISDYFQHPIDLFDALEATTILNILNKIDLKVIKKNIQKPIEFDQLSEGEQQLLTILGLILVTGKDDCLFLFDEPDTHLNPEWQRDFPNLIREFNLNSENSHVIIATHSPLIVQSSNDSDVFLFRKNENDEVQIDSSPHQIHNWRIDQVLVSDYFGLPTARPVSLDEYMELREKILSKNIVTEEDAVLLKAFENKFGVLPTGETINDIKAMTLVRKITNKIGND